jgi:hypothetical protein
MERTPIVSLNVDRTASYRVMRAELSAAMIMSDEGINNTDD